MRRVTAADFTPTRWKNGQGQTTQIAVSPDGAGLDDFTWRVSVAAITEDGAFSRFAGVERSLVVLAGAGVSLSLRDSIVMLRPGQGPFRFAGDEPVRAALCDGPVRDFNVMTRRRAASHRVVPVTGGATAVAQDVTLLFACAAMALTVSGERVALGAEEALLLEPAERLAVGAGHGLLVSIRPAGRWSVSPFH